MFGEGCAVVRLIGLRPRLAARAPRLAAAPKRALPFYQQPEWIALRKSRVGDPDWVAAKKRAKPGERLILDHVIEIRDGGAPLDPKNTQWLTFSEHQAKTEKAKRARVGLG